ncbi:MAG: acyl-ACP--UDP-N-acetylglucosamine O-acyltransferase [Lentisphaeria bacterium]|nr:acyl-ACP--UDP-N-acetylglucosamine O-acyltransferase [Lentisphaeria bacterium]
MSIHSTAVIDPGAELGRDVAVAPYAVIDAHVRVGDGCTIGPHVHISGHTTIGAMTRVHAGAVIGDLPQDHHYDGAVTYTEIGRQCVIREYVTIHRGTIEGSRTVVGDGTMLMGFVHLGHNCDIGEQVVIANGTMLAGHVEVGPRAFVSAGVLVHQFVRIGRLAMIGGGNGIGQDVPPFCMLQYDQIQGPNVVGLRRAALAEAARAAIRGAIKIYFFSGLNRPNAIEEIRATCGSHAEVSEFVAFIESTKRGICPGRLSKPRRAAE